MTLQQLAYFVALVEVGSFTGAAVSLRVAQPTLSRQVKALEDELGSPLVQRTRNALILTPAGEAVLPLARRMLADMESARTAVAELVGLQRGRVRVGAPPSLCTGVLADVLRIFHERSCTTRSTWRWSASHRKGSTQGWSSPRCSVSGCPSPRRPPGAVRRRGGR